MDPSKIKEKIGRFRILIIGRANAGKTTILRRVCNTRENPEIYNSAGKKIEPAVLLASRERGEHDIENAMVFRNNPGFIFHDSRGFEAGGESEFDKVNAFIARRSKETRITNQLHVIWYCIPMDEASRSFTEAEIKFFSQCDTGSIPVIVLFTKFDALYTPAYSELKSNGASREQARELAPKHAEESFAKGSQLEFLYRPEDIGRPPKCHVCLPNMDNDNADCRALIERTAGTLDSEVLKQLFVSTQQTNLELCMQYAVERTLPKLFDSIEALAPKSHQDIIGRLGGWFPHIWMNLDLLNDDNNLNFLNNDNDLLFDNFFLDLDDDNLLDDDTDKFDASHREEMRSRLHSLASGSSPLETIVQLSSAAVIIFEHSFYIYDKRRYLQDQQKSVPSFEVALKQYIVSPHAAAVRKAVRVAVHTCQGTSSTWTDRLPFARFQKKGKQPIQPIGDSQKMELIEAIVSITLEHRLPRP